MTPIQRRRLLQAIAATPALAALPWRAAHAQQRIDTLRIVTGFTPGGTSDTLCRRVADRMRGDYVRTAVVDNKAGAGGQLAIDLMRSAPTDGSTILQTPASMLMIYPHIYRKLAYDPFADLAPITVACTFEFGFAVGPMVPDSVASMQIGRAHV